MTPPACSVSESELLWKDSGKLVGTDMSGEVACICQPGYDRLWYPGTHQKLAPQTPGQVGFSAVFEVFLLISFD